MNSLLFKAFVKHASSNENTPGDYMPVKIAVMRMFPKLAVSLKWVANHAARGVSKRMDKSTEIGFGLLDRAKNHARLAKSEPFASHRLKRDVLATTIGDTVHGRAKTAGLGVAGAEVAGLGVLARPSFQTLRNRQASQTEHSHAKHELAGLGILAAHPAYEIGSHFLSKAKPAATQAANFASKTLHL